MVLVLKKTVSDKDFQKIVERIKSLGFKPHISRGVKKTIIGLIGENAEKYREVFESMPGVDFIREIEKPYKLVSREFKEKNTVINVNGVKIGSKKIVVMAGPCAVESREQLLKIAEIVKRGGAVILRGGAYKPRTSPYSFQGLGEEGLRYLADAKSASGLLTVSEALSPEQVDIVAKYVDIIQIGARNVQNYDLLKKVGEIKKPVLLKRGMSTTIEEYFLSAEYILSHGNPDVILCERGIRTFESLTRFTLDLSAVPLIKKMSHLPVIVDPSHGIGIRDLVIPMAKAAIAAGADGLLIEVHNKPEEALSDGAQSLYPRQFKKLMREIKTIAEAVGREF